MYEENRQYLDAAHEEVQNEYLSADGGDTWEGAEGDYIEEEAGQDWSAEGWNDDEMYAAHGGGHGKPAQSAPFILQIVNASSSAIASVDIGDSYTNRTVTNFGQNSSITTTSTISGVTYIEFLAESEGKPFKVGKTMIISTSAGQLDQTVAVTHRNGRGDRRDHVITPTLDPNQNQTDRVIDDYEYMFDGYTRLRVNQINASATVTIRIYPKTIYSPTKMAQAGPQGRGNIGFRPPHIVRSAQVPVGRRMR